MSISRVAYRALKIVADNGPVLRFGVQIAIDSAAWAIAILLAGVLRFELELERVNWVGFGLLALATILVQVVAGLFFHLYRGRYPYGSFAEVLALITVVGLTAVVMAVPVIFAGNEIGLPRSTILLAAPIAIFVMSGSRYIKRLVVERTRRSSEDAVPTLIYGAGETGSYLVRRMLRDPSSRYLPVGLIDDNPSRRNAWFDGVRVLGTGGQLGEIVQKTGATTLVVAIARADSELLRRIADLAAPFGLRVHVLPPFEEIIAGRSRLRDLRDVSIEDLIGRHPVDMEIEMIAGYLRDKRVLVTGAGGSIGGELCRQISRFEPSILYMLDRDETGLQHTQLSVQGNGLLDDDSVVLADIRDAEQIGALFERLRPQVVFHAAALKHLPMLERYPEEAWKTNVVGTLNLLEAATAVGVETFVNISTDKAASPTSVLGASKRVAERLTAWFGETRNRRYLSVRFGNVLGSRGSLIPTFTALIEAGAPLTVTHPDATRYFMTIPEACQLVVQAGAIGHTGEVMILDMGEPVRILDIAHRMIEMSGKDVSIVYTGLRAGEKLHEDLFAPDEDRSPTAHSQISTTRIEPTSPGSLDDLHGNWPEVGFAQTGSSA